MLKVNCYNTTTIYTVTQTDMIMAITIYLMPLKHE
jgi:hypothetical protein